MLFWYVGKNVENCSFGLLRRNTYRTYVIACKKTFLLPYRDFDKIIAFVLPCCTWTGTRVSVVWNNYAHRFAYNKVRSMLFSERKTIFQRLIVDFSSRSCPVRTLNRWRRRLVQNENSALRANITDQIKEKYRLKKITIRRVEKRVVMSQQKTEIFEQFSVIYGYTVCILFCGHYLLHCRILVLLCVWSMSITSPF